MQNGVICMKKILLVDDSALMRRVLCDIINSDGRFSVTAEACNGLEALEYLKKEDFDAVVLDVNMPKLDGLGLLRELKSFGINARILMASTVTEEGGRITMEALELGASDFIHKPDWSFKCKEEEFRTSFLDTLEAVASAKVSIDDKNERTDDKVVKDNIAKVEELIRKKKENFTGERIVALAVSTGGPKSLQSVIPLLPKDLAAPVVLVQHMPEGFTASLASRLNSISDIKVKEGEEGETIHKGCVYIAKAGKHLKLIKNGKDTIIKYTDEAYREGVKPCANYMYESLASCDYDEVVCVVMTGMGADGTEGIKNLKKSGQKSYVITQEGDSCVVYGMPKACFNAGLSDSTVTLTQIAQEIILRVGVKQNGC